MGQGRHTLRSVSTELMAQNTKFFYFLHKNSNTSIFNTMTNIKPVKSHY